jgi:predicted peroxiredoxin
MSTTPALETFSGVKSTPWFTAAVVVADGFGVSVVVVMGGVSAARAAPPARQAHPAANRIVFIVIPERPSARRRFDKARRRGAEAVFSAPAIPATHGVWRTQPYQLRAGPG